MGIADFLRSAVRWLKPQHYSRGAAVGGKLLVDNDSEFSEIVNDKVYQTIAREVIDLVTTSVRYSLHTRAEQRKFILRKVQEKSYWLHPRASEDALNCLIDHLMQ